MAFITKQWLKHLPDRIKPHEPVKVELLFEDIKDTWCRDHRIKQSFKLIRPDGVYQTVFLESKDLTFLALQLATASDKKSQESVALALLQSLESAAVARVLSQYFTNRAGASEA